MSARKPARVGAAAAAAAATVGRVDNQPMSTVGAEDWGLAHAPSPEAGHDSFLRAASAVPSPVMQGVDADRSTPLLAADRDDGSTFSLSDLEHEHEASGGQGGVSAKKTRNKTVDKVAFWVIGNLTDFVYIIFILAAQDMLKGTNLPTTTSLLADILPATILKTVFPWVLYDVPYPVRVILQVFLSCGAFVLAALGTEVWMKLCGIVIGSLSCGLGEITYLALTAKYDREVIGWYSSGLGSSGPLGGAFYILLTLVVGLDDRSTLLLLSPLPFIILLCYFSLSSPDPAVAGPLEGASLAHHHELEQQDKPGHRGGNHKVSTSLTSSPLTAAERLKAVAAAMPYFGALFLVFLAEYISLNGVVTVIAFPDAQIFGHHLSQRGHYMIYMYTYAISVFISRTSINLFRIPYLWPQSLLQALTCVALVLQVVYRFITSVYVMFAITLWMGLLGGSVFVNAFYLLRTSDRVPDRYREFTLGIGTGADSVGIALAGVINMFLEPALFDYCTKHYPDIAAAGYCRTRGG